MPKLPNQAVKQLTFLNEALLLRFIKKLKHESCPEWRFRSGTKKLEPWKRFTSDIFLQILNSPLYYLNDHVMGHNQVEPWGLMTLGRDHSHG